MFLMYRSASEVGGLAQIWTKSELHTSKVDQSTLREIDKHMLVARASNVTTLRISSTWCVQLQNTQKLSTPANEEFPPLPAAGADQP